MPKPRKPSSRRTPAESGLRSATRTKLLNAAENLFATHGADRISVRQITDAAGANLGAVNYHFGSKDRLLMAVFSRRLKAVNGARLARLDALELAAGKRPVKIRDIIDAMIRPTMESLKESVGHSEAMMRLLSRMHCEQNPAIKKFVQDQFEEVVYRFDASLMRTVKGFTRADIYWRMVYLVGALTFAQDYWLRFADSAHPGHVRADGTTDLRRPSRETFVREIIDFFTGGFAATRVPVKRSGAKRKRARRA